MDDAREIENLIYRYAELIDSGELQGLAELFATGEIISREHNTQISGTENVLKLYRNSCRIYESTGTPRTKHLTTNVIIEKTGPDHAAARSYYTVLQSTESLPLQAIITGRYIDTFEKRNGAWTFKTREMVIDNVGDCSAHLLYDTTSLQ
ncbi:MAG: nuclear transport factor 2 family protein [Gammaproteobacteria bacterium]|jgi:3-phenylpropionate/cinnamic acid dioxygenase small subunit|nr:nuclear transport factor 2 family protein [Gammaproteobacteria bacterium]